MTFESTSRIVLVVGSLLVLSCQSGVSQTKFENPDRPSEATAAPPAKESSDEVKKSPTEASGTCDDRACAGSEDCCKGYSCGFDPERSKVQRYCMAE